ncbi:MAG TPA: alpha/beta fold hydrolase [Phenylobacterium sp.]|mgnify:CR=1 FL=1|nr:alpha/beta fold hydrolase [Phenylobacterium sp.]HQP19896.1 alpha/beta fold hydrolase [Phenylobacterium sp.]
MLSFVTSDGVRLAYADEGEGRPVLLLHGFLSSGHRNWSRLIPALTGAGLRVIAPDCRGHGASDAPTAPEAWPADVMARDVLELAAQLGLSDFDLVGYSMGGRTAIRAMVGGLKPRRLVIGGMGEFGVMEAGPRAEAFEDALRHGEAASDPGMGRAIANALAAQGLKAQAMLGVLASFQLTTEAEIRALRTDALVILGTEDHDNGSGQVLADWLGGRFLPLPGDHGQVPASPAFVEAVVEFLSP